MNDFLRDNASTISMVLSVVAGLSVTLVVWLFTRAVTDVPLEDRAYKDPPPLGFRLLWWPVQWLSFLIDSWMPSKSKHALLGRLRQAGLDYGLSPVQFVAGRLIFAFCAGVFAWWLHAVLSSEGASVSALQTAILLAIGGWLMPALWLKDKVDVRKRELLKSLPFFLDLITLCVEAGLNLQSGITQSVAKGPEGALRDELQRVLRDLRAGKPRAASLRDMSERVNEPGVTSFVTAVIQAEVMGMNMGPILRLQADQRRAERFLRAEKLAMQAPVKMLLPLVAFIFPCTFIVLFFPIAMKFMHSGL